MYFQKPVYLLLFYVNFRYPNHLCIELEYSGFCPVYPF